jgi:hypothetical protein
MAQMLANWTTNLPAGSAHVAGTWLAALLTVAVLSYILGENGIYRLAGHLFIGVAAGYAGGLAWHAVLWPRAQLLLSDPAGHWVYGLFFALGLALLLRGIGPVSALADIPLAVMFGVGSAVALMGAVGGTLVPQIRAAVVSLAPASYGSGAAGWARAIDALLLLVATLAVLASFHFARPSAEAANPGATVMVGMGKLGRKVLMMALGALFAAALLSFFAALQGRLAFLINDWGALLRGMGF